MKNLRWIINLLFIIIIHSAYADGFDQVKSPKMDNSNMKTIIFSDLKNTDYINKDITAFSAVLNISEIQSASNGGINFELDLKYGGDNDIDIHNPIYFVQYSLKGSHNAQLYNGGKPPILLINRKGPINETTDFNFDILAIKKNGESMNIKEQVNKSIIHFQKEDKQSYFLQISKYLSRQTGQLEDIPGGIYQLELLFSIVGNDAIGSALQDRTLGIQDISLSFKKE